MTTQQTGITEQLASQVEGEELNLDASPASTTTESASTETAAAWQAPDSERTPGETATSPSEVPAEPPPPSYAPPPQAPVPGTLNHAEKQRLQYLEQQERTWQQTQERQRLEQEIGEVQRQHEAAGWDTQTAQYMANLVRGEREQSVQREQQLYQFIQQDHSRRTFAEHYAKQYGVSAAELARFNSAPEMEYHAQILQGHRQEKEYWEKRMTNVEQRLTPDQHFDGGTPAGSGPPSLDASLAALGNNPDMAISQEVIDKYNQANR